MDLNNDDEGMVARDLLYMTMASDKPYREEEENSSDQEDDINRDDNDDDGMEENEEENHDDQTVEELARELMVACKIGNLEQVKKCIETKRVDINMHDPKSIYGVCVL